jgi:NAD(P)-dependent dehydrogenase (short-subunit alcohol dehydrogenase family)
VYQRLAEYLADASSRFPQPTGFAGHLAGLRLSRFTVGRLDPVTKLFLPVHPLRFVLNGAVALHECDAQGYRELAGSPQGWRAWLVLAGLGLRYIANLAVSLPWLAWQWACYSVVAPFRASVDLAGARVLITGVNRGLGRDLMLQCLDYGADVVGLVRRGESRNRLLAELPPGRVTLLDADLSRPEALRRALEQSPVAPESLSMVILSAAVKHDGASVLSLRDLRDTFEVNFFSAAELVAWLCGPEPPTGSSRGSAAAAPLTREDLAHAPRLSSTTRVVLVSSMGRWHGMPWSAGYNASKAALSIWGESLDMELRQRRPGRYSVTIVEPGMFPSDMMRQTPLTRMLFASRSRVAHRIVVGALAGRAVLRPPRWFALLTWALCAIGRGGRARFLARMKPPVDR